MTAFGSQLVRFGISAFESIEGRSIAPRHAELAMRVPMFLRSIGFRAAPKISHPPTSCATVWLDNHKSFIPRASDGSPDCTILCPSSSHRKWNE